MAIGNFIVLYYIVLASVNAVHGSPLIDSMVKIAHNTKIGPNVRIERKVMIGENVTIGENSIIHEHAVIGDNVEIDRNAYIGSYTNIQPYASIGESAVIHDHVNIPAGQVIVQNEIVIPRPSFYDFYLGGDFASSEESSLNATKTDYKIADNRKRVRVWRKLTQSLVNNGMNMFTEMCSPNFNGSLQKISLQHLMSLYVIRAHSLSDVRWDSFVMFGREDETISSFYEEHDCVGIYTIKCHPSYRTKISFSKKFVLSEYQGEGEDEVLKESDENVRSVRSNNANEGNNDAEDNDCDEDDKKIKRNDIIEQGKGKKKETNGLEEDDDYRDSNETEKINDLIVETDDEDDYGGNISRKILTPDVEKTFIQLLVLNKDLDRDLRVTDDTFCLMLRQIRNDERQIKFSFPIVQDLCNGRTVEKKEIIDAKCVDEKKEKKEIKNLVEQTVGVQMTESFWPYYSSGAPLSSVQSIISFCYFSLTLGTFDLMLKVM